MMRMAGVVMALALCGCGYRVAGRGDLLPKNIRTIAVTAFNNSSIEYRLAERLPADVTREFISRTRYRVVADPNEADAVLSGSLINVTSFSTVFDPQSQRGTGVQVEAILSVIMTDRSTGAVIFTRPNLIFRERYEISVDPKAYFEENEPAMLRLSRDVARSVVSAVLENF